MVSRGEKIGPFQILLVALSVYVLIALFVESVAPISAASHRILSHVDTAICIVFLYDFCQRFLHAKSKLKFLRWGWIDLVSSIPALPILRIGRLFRVVRVLRVLRAVRSVRTIGQALFEHRAKGTVVTAVFLCTLLIVFSSITILDVENVPESNIHGPEDALWWSFVTVTTVGYGDRFPVTTEGRVVASILMLSGVGLFAILAGAFTAWFTQPSQVMSQDAPREDKQITVLIQEIRALRAEIGEVPSIRRSD